MNGRELRWMLRRIGLTYEQLHKNVKSGCTVATIQRYVSRNLVTPFAWEMILEAFVGKNNWAKLKEELAVAKKEGRIG